MNISPTTAFAVILIIFSAIAIIAVLSPATLVRNFGGPKVQRAPMRELFLRVAGILLLAGAMWKLYEWWRFR